MEIYTPTNLRKNLSDLLNRVADKDEKDTIITLLYLGSKIPKTLRKHICFQRKK